MIIVELNLHHFRTAESTRSWRERITPKGPRASEGARERRGCGWSGVLSEGWRKKGRKGGSKGEGGKRDRFDGKPKGQECQKGAEQREPPQATSRDINCSGYAGDRREKTVKERWFVFKSREATDSDKLCGLHSIHWRLVVNSQRWHSIAKAISPELLWR